MTYEELFDAALKELELDPDDIEKYRPASPIFIPELKYPISDAIIIWLKSGSSVIYIGR